MVKYVFMSTLYKYDSRKGKLQKCLRLREKVD